MVIEAVRNHRMAAHCYIPNLVVAEVFSAFDRACYSRWDAQIGRQFGGASRTLDKRRYRSARSRFRKDIHNGALFYQYDLSRYHILALDLIAPIDKHRKFYRSKNVRSMGAFDLLIGAMAMHLVRLHGREKVFLISTDRRMNAIFADVPSTLRQPTVRALGLDLASSQLGFGRWRPEIYPSVIDLARCKRKDLKMYFGDWPLKTRKTRNTPGKS